MRQLITPGVPIRVTELDLGLREPDPDAVYHIRLLTPEVSFELNKKYTRRVPNPATQRTEESTDGLGLYRATLDYVIDRWEGVVGECDAEHKMKLPEDVQVALLQRARMGGPNADAQAASFRRPAGVSGLVGRSTPTDAVLPVRAAGGADR
jgi:hypothetical protein